MSKDSDSDLFEGILFFLTASDKERDEVAGAGWLIGGAILSLASLVIGFIANIIYISSSSWIGILIAIILFIIGFAAVALGSFLLYEGSFWLYKLTKWLRCFLAVVPLTLFCLGIWFAT